MVSARSFCPLKGSSRGTPSQGSWRPRLQNPHGTGLGLQHVHRTASTVTGVPWTTISYIPHPLNPNFAKPSHNGRPVRCHGVSYECKGFSLLCVPEVSKNSLFLLGSCLRHSAWNRWNHASHANFKKGCAATRCEGNPSIPESPSPYTLSPRQPPMQYVLFVSSTLSLSLSLSLCVS